MKGHEEIWLKTITKGGNKSILSTFYSWGSSFFTLVLSMRVVNQPSVICTTKRIMYITYTYNLYNSSIFPSNIEEKDIALVLSICHMCKIKPGTGGKVSSGIQEHFADRSVSEWVTEWLSKLVERG